MARKKVEDPVQKAVEVLISLGKGIIADAGDLQQLAGLPLSFEIRQELRSLRLLAEGRIKVVRRALRENIEWLREVAARLASEQKDGQTTAAESMLLIEEAGPPNLVVQIELSLADVASVRHFQEHFSRLQQGAMSDDAMGVISTIRSVLDGVSQAIKATEAEKNEEPQQ